MGTKSKSHADVGRRIAGERRALGISVADFARLVELSQNHVYVIERGEKLPHARKLARIASALGLRVEWLRDGKGRKKLRDGEQNGGDES